MHRQTAVGAYGKPSRSPSNRSLERGIAVLRAFRPGSELLGNGEIAERTGLPRATVSRLTQTLVAAGMLQVDAAMHGYRLAPAVLSLAHAMRSGSPVLALAAPRMRALAERERVNVGLAAPDGDEMVYLESIRYNRRAALRNVVSGQRVPMELTSLGRAHLATVEPVRLRALMTTFRLRRGAQQWTRLSAEIRDAIAQVHAGGFCAASWQPEVVAVSAPLVIPGAAYVLNVSVSTGESAPAVVGRLAPLLIALTDEIGRLVGPGA